MAEIDRMIAYMKYTSENSLYYEKQPKNPCNDYTVVAVGDKWKVVKDDDSVWTYYYIPNVLLPIQGWKIHISTALDEAESVLECVSKILIEREIPFKHIRSNEALMSMYSKNGNRITSGKFITIYPQGDEFLELLDVLEDSLKGFRKGPYILTDKQWKNSNVFFRYGAFKKMVSPSGEMCLLDADGNLTPDLRKPCYYVPPFVKVPKKLSEADNVFDESQPTENRLKNYKIENALRFSNSGGIYKAKRIKDGVACIIKEARAEIGYDGVNHNAAQRLENECNMLRKLNHIPGIVNVLDYFKVWENTFLVEEFVEGIEFAKWIAMNYPFSIRDDLNEYYNKVSKIMNRLKDIIDSMHEAGVAMCDLQIRNVIIHENLEVTIIDFEIATSTESKENTGMATKGFCHSLNMKAAEKDWYALNRIMQYAFLPIGAAMDIDVELNRVHCRWIKNVFGNDVYNYFINYQMECCKHLSNEKEIFKDTYNVEEAKKCFKEQDVYSQLHDMKENLLNGLIENCQCERNSLINGDIRQFETDCGELNLFTGGFGAILALARENRLPEWIDEWINKSTERLFSTHYNDGFLTGRSGIVATLFECGYQEQAIKLAQLVMDEYNRDSFDLTLRSGLSGIGLMFVALYTETNDIKYLEECKEIATNITKKIESKQPLVRTDWDSVEVGLSDGFPGISLFYTLLYQVTKDETYLQYSKILIQKEINNSVVSDRDGSMQAFDQSRTRLLPYLSTGSIGLGIAISLYHQLSKHKEFENELKAILKVGEYRCCCDSGLFDGAGGFFVLALLADDCNQMHMIHNAMERLKLLLVQKQNKSYLPGKNLFKLSSDMYSGAAGVILAFQAVERKNSLVWLPILHKIIEKEGEKNE